MTTIKRDFSPADRYLYDFEVLTTAKRWAQLDTSQDASYFGQWLNPTTRQIFCYCEGDCILTTCDTDAELVREVGAIRQWNHEQGHRFMGIDAGFNEDLRGRLIESGLGHFFHACEVTK